MCKAIDQYKEMSIHGNVDAQVYMDGKRKVNRMLNPDIRYPFAISSSN